MQRFFYLPTNTTKLVLFWFSVSLLTCLLSACLCVFHVLCMLERLATKYAQVCKRPGFCATLEYRMEISVTAKKLGSRSSCQRNIIKFTWNSRRRRMIQPESRADKRTCRINLQCGCRLPVWQANCGDGRVAYASSPWYLLRCRDACRLLSLSLRLLILPRPAICVRGVLRWSWSGGTAFHQLQVTEPYSAQNDRCRNSVPPRSALLWSLQFDNILLWRNCVKKLLSQHTDEHIDIGPIFVPEALWWSVNISDFAKYSNLLL